MFLSLSPSPYCKDTTSGTCCPRGSDCWPSVCALPVAGLGFLCMSQPQGPGSRSGWGTSSPPPSGPQWGGPLNGSPLHHCWNNPEGPHLRYDNLRLWFRYSIILQLLYAFSFLYILVWMSFSCQKKNQLKFYVNMFSCTESYVINWGYCPVTSQYTNYTKLNALQNAFISYHFQATAFGIPDIKDEHFLEKTKGLKELWLHHGF